MNDNTKAEQLIDKASKAEKSDDALRFSQAALNVAHAQNILADIGKDGK